MSSWVWARVCITCSTFLERVNSKVPCEVSSPGDPGILIWSTKTDTLFKDMECLLILVFVYSESGFSENSLESAPALSYRWLTPKADSRLQLRTTPTCLSFLRFYMVWCPMSFLRWNLALFLKQSVCEFNNGGSSMVFRVIRGTKTGLCCYRILWVGLV